MQESDMHWISSVPIGISLFVIGTVGNIVSIIVWRRVFKYHRGTSTSKSVSLYLISLALFDTGLLLFYFLVDSLPAVFHDITNNHVYNTFYAWIGFPMFFFFIVVSIWMVVGVTINRLIIVRFPTRAKILVTKRNTVLGIAAIVMASFCVNIPHFFNYEVISINGSSKVTLTEYGLSESAKNYGFWAHCIVLVLVPWLLILVSNTFIIVSIKRNSKKMISISEKMKEHRRLQERKMTTTLLLVTFTFLWLLAWQCISQCFYMLKHGQKNGKITSTWQNVDDAFAFGKLGVIINSSINILLYCLSGSSFRKELVKLIYTYGPRQAQTPPMELKSTSTLPFTMQSAKSLRKFTYKCEDRIVSNVYIG